MTAIRPGLPPLPPKMAHLPIDERGFPVPWFVELIDGKPDHRVMCARKLPLAIKHGLCWQCGGPMGRFMTFVIGPMCSITRSISEPPSHLECARYAATACPFLTRPHAKRREAGMPEHREMAGIGIGRNPGVVCLWTTREYKVFHAGRGQTPGGDGVMFEIGAPTSTEWYAEGRPATRAEVDESIESGLPLLREAAELDGPDGLAHLERCIVSARDVLERAMPAPA